jgi:hypothetical protein
MSMASFPITPPPFLKSSDGVSEEQVPAECPSTGHVCQTPNLDHLITQERIVILAAPAHRIAERGFVASKPTAGRSLPRTMAEIGLWGGGVTAFVLIPFGVAALVAAPLILAGQMILGSAEF